MQEQPGKHRKGKTRRDTRPRCHPGLPWDQVGAERAGRPGSHAQGPEAKAVSWLSGEQLHSHNVMSTGFISLKTVPALRKPERGGQTSMEAGPRGHRTHSEGTGAG